MNFYSIILFIVCANITFLWASSPLGYSGMDQLNNHTYVVVHDLGSSSRQNRIAFLSVKQSGGVQYTPIKVDNWKSKVWPNDMESITVLPTGKNEILVGESGYWGRRYGRLFHIKLTGNSGKVINIYPLPRLKNNGKPVGYDNFEGLESFQYKNETILALGERGGSSAHPQGTVVFGVLNRKSKKIDWKKYQHLSFSVNAPGKWEINKRKRSIADIHIDDNQTIWISAAEDNGNNGPFKSVIFKVGQIEKKSSLTVRQYSTINPLWICDGLKVEGLSGKTSRISRSMLSIGTEDENFPGIWRPLFKPSGN